jgi:hypothetical protein
LLLFFPFKRHFFREKIRKWFQHLWNYFYEISIEVS